MAYDIEKLELRTDSSLYLEAIRLRHEVFFKPQGLDPEVVLDDLEPSSRHFALVESDRLIAYARLTSITKNEAKISQMVVMPDQQGRGLGKMLLEWLIEDCGRNRIDKVTLEARKTKVGFYALHGFRCVGEPYPSHRTGILHVHMERLMANREKLEKIDRPHLG
jgi:predicted GNAT family N-acyltransferase